MANSGLHDDDDDDGAVPLWCLWRNKIKFTRTLHNSNSGCRNGGTNGTGNYRNGVRSITVSTPSFRSWDARSSGPASNDPTIIRGPTNHRFGPNIFARAAPCLRQHVLWRWIVPTSTEEILWRTSLRMWWRQCSTNVRWRQCTALCCVNRSMVCERWQIDMGLCQHTTSTNHKHSL